MDVERAAAWVAICQPAVIRLLEDELGDAVGDALAAGLALAHQVLVEQTLTDGVPLPRLSPRGLAEGWAVADPAEQRARAAALPLLLDGDEVERVARAAAAVTWAAARARHAA